MQHLALVLKERGLNINKLTQLCGLSRPVVSRIVNGRQIAHADQRLAIAGALGLAVEAIRWPSLNTVPMLTPAKQREIILERQYAKASGDLARAHGYDVIERADEGRREEEETRRMLEVDQVMVDDAAFETELERRLRNKAFVKALAQRIAEQERAAS